MDGMDWQEVAARAQRPPKGPMISPAASLSGSFSKFVNVISARTAVGHDRKGQLVLFHVDGQTELRG